MFVEVFGLKHNPFRARTSGGDVFVGPQQANVVSGLKKALAAADAVVSVTGPVGVGKTTIVGRALDTISSQRAVARIGRMQLGREEVVELLLTEFGITSLPAGRLQRFAVFKRLLTQCGAKNIRLFVVVEDASQIGVDALVELESLTAADTDDVPGANVVLMGPPSLKEVLTTPALVRLRQRVRRQQAIAPFSIPEVRGYLTHRLRQAGGDLERLLEPAAVEIIHRCSEGIPRVINNLCEAALVAAAEAKVPTLSPTLIAKIAREQFGFDGDAPASKPPADAPAPNRPEAAPVASPSKRAAPATPQEDAEIPELIQDTMPEMKALELPGAENSVKYSDDLMTPKAPASEIQSLKDKTDNTHPSLPVLTLPDRDAPAATDPLQAADELRMKLEPRAPEPLSKDSDPADTQTIKALDSALRPDTQLLRALEEPAPLVEDDTPVPLGLQAPSGEQPSPSPSHTDTLPTLSDSMRLDAAPPAHGRKKPDIDALEAALAVARKGPIDLNDGPREAAQTPTTAGGASASAPDRPNAVPEITLDDSIEQQRLAAQAKLAEEAAKRAAQEAEQPAKDQTEQPPAGEDPHAGLSTIAEQLSSGDLTAAVEMGANDDAKDAEAEKDTADRARLEKVAAKLGSATTLEDIDDTAAETLFGEEFSQLAAQVVAMAANDLEAQAEPETAESRGREAAPLELAAEPPAAAATPEPAALELAAEPSAASAPASSQPTAAAESGPSQPPPKTTFGKPDIDSSAARRLEMVRSLNQNKQPTNGQGPVEIVLGGDDAPKPQAGGGEKPEPIENQFGTSMTATLEALSAQTIKTMQAEEEKEEQKKGGLLSRFKRS